MPPTELSKDSMRFYCKVHDIFKFKDMMGRIVCPFCQRERDVKGELFIWEDNT